MKTQIKQYAGVLLAATVVIGGIASAAITPIPTISNTFAVAGQVIKSADINKLAEALNILDARTKWVDVPLTDTADFDTKCEYRFSNIATAKSMIAEYILPSVIRISTNMTDNGHILTSVFYISNTNKANAVHYAEAPTGGMGSMTYPVTSLQKRCE